MSSAPRGFTPRARVVGRLRAPGSKSVAQRALIAAALASGSTRLVGLPDGEDVAQALRLVAAVGAAVDRLAPRAVRIVGLPPGPQRGWNPAGRIEVGESGTLARFALAALAFTARAGRTLELDARGTLRRRSSPALVRALESSGVEFANRTWPLAFVALGPPSRVELVDASSSQEVSALLVALAAYPDEIELAVRGEIPSRPYVELTRAVLARFGVEVREEVRAEERIFRVRGPLRAPSQPIEVEADASLAAVALVAACVSDGEVVALGLGRESAQGDLRILEHLSAFGCRAEFASDGLRAAGRPQRGARLDLSGEPDLAPVLAVVAARVLLEHAAAESELVGLETLPGKESSRIEVLARGFAAAGWRVESDARSLRFLAAPTGPARACVLDPASDHRMAFAFALLGLVREGITVADPECVAKSWPGFWRDLESLGARAAN